MIDMHTVLLSLLASFTFVLVSGIFLSVYMFHVVIVLSSFNTDVMPYTA